MQLVVLGLNHKTASVDVRECFTFSEEKIKTALNHLHEYEEISECVLSLYLQPYGDVCSSG